MIKIVRFFGKMLGALLIPILILASFVSILLMSIDSQFFNQDFYLEVFREQDLFEKLPAVAADQITYAMTFNPCLEDPDMCEGDGSQVSSSDSSSGGPPSYFQAMSKSDWEMLIAGILPPEWLEDKLVEVTDGLVEAFDTGEKEAEIAISLADLKERLGGPAGVEAIIGVLDAQPICTEEDLLSMTRVLEGSEDPGESFLTCRPSDDFIEKYSPHLEVMLRRSLRDVPDKIDLGKGLLSADQDLVVDFMGYEVPPALVMRWVHWFIQMSPLFCMALMLVIGLLAIQSFKGMGGWWGYPVTIAGLMGLGLSLLVSPLAARASTFLLENRSMTGISPILVETGGSMANELVQVLMRQVRNFSLITIGIGLAIVITAAVLSPVGKAKEKVDPMSAAPEEMPEEKEEEIPDPQGEEPEEDQAQPEKPELDSESAESEGEESE